MHGASAHAKQCASLHWQDLLGSSAAWVEHTSHYSEAEQVMQCVKVHEMIGAGCTLPGIVLSKAVPCSLVTVSKKSYVASSFGRVAEKMRVSALNDAHGGRVVEF